MIQWLQGNQTPLITLNFVLSNRLGNAEQLFRKYCPGYAMLCLSQFPPACSALLATSYSVNNSPNPKNVFLEGEDEGAISSGLYWCKWKEDQVQIYCYPETLRKGTHIHTSKVSNMKRQQPLLHVVHYVSDYKLRLNECISSSTCYLNYTILWAMKINYVKHSLGRMGSVFLLWFCHQVSNLSHLHFARIISFTTQKA